MAITAINLATLALASATDEARLPRELAPLESFESLEALNALDAFMVLTRQQSLLSLQVLQLNLVEASLRGVSLQSQLSSRQSAE